MSTRNQNINFGFILQEHNGKQVTLVDELEGNFSGTFNGLSFNTSSLVYSLITIPAAIHGVPVTMSNPFTDGSVPIGFIPYSAKRLGTSASLGIENYEFSGNITTNSYYLSTNYDLQHNKGLLHYRKSVNQGITGSAAERISWEVAFSGNDTGNGLMSVQSGTTGRVSRLVVSEDGNYQIEGTIAWAANNNGWRLIHLTPNDDDSGANKRHGSARVQATSGSANTQLVFVTTMPLLSGNWVEVWAAQGAGAFVDLQANGSNECSVKMSRVYNSSTPTGSITGIIVRK
jgi:hypothetical protein